MTAGALRLLQRLEGVADIGVEPAAAGIQMRKNRLAHPRVQNFLMCSAIPGTALSWPWL